MEFKMVDVGLKEATRRKSMAQGKIQLSLDAFLALRDGKNPKGNVLAAAEVAGIMAAKKTSDLLPLCHPLPIERVFVSFSLDEVEYSVTVYSEVLTTAKTGVEMEALASVMGALLCIYDLCKAVSPDMTISDVRVNLKEGGKSGRWVHPSDLAQPTQLTPPAQPGLFEERHSALFEGMRVSVLTISDRVSAGKMEDTSGPALEKFFQQRGATVRVPPPLPDEKREIQSCIWKEIRQGAAQLVVTTGGTGIGPRDQTPEAILEICDRTIPGLGECLRSQGGRVTPFAWLSRSLGAMVGGSIVIALPGSLKAVREGLEALEKFLPHALAVVQGDQHDSK